MMRSLLFWLVATVSWFGLATICEAVPVIVTFEGPLDEVSSALAGRFSLGDRMQVSITYESSWPDGHPDPDTGWYECVLAFSALVDSTMGYTATATDGWWNINNDFPSGDPFAADQVFAHINSPASPSGGTLAGPDVAGLPLWTFFLQLHDDSMTALSSDALPLSFDPADFDNNQIGLAWREGGANRWIKAEDLRNSSYVIPAPGAALLGVLGLGLISANARRRKRRGRSGE